MGIISNANRSSDLAASGNVPVPAVNPDGDAPAVQSSTDVFSNQHRAMEEKFASEEEAWRYQHDTTDPLMRYFRDRRLHTIMRILKMKLGDDLSEQSALVVCGGTGGEATFLFKQGFHDVTNSDFSQNALVSCQQREPRAKCIELNAEQMDLPDNSFDLLIVKDGLHHLPRPVLGFNEMVRVARKAVVVIEPAEGVAARLLGRTWEWNGDTVNYVFRWNRWLFEQSLRSQVLQSNCQLVFRRMWDHHVAVDRIVSKCSRSGRLKLLMAKLIYGCLRPLNFAGNQAIGVVFKNDCDSPKNPTTKDVGKAHPK